MTEKLYYKDAYLAEFTATVLACETAENGYRIVLDKTAFFPEEGGQYSDRGYIESARVSDVREESGVIYHIADSPVTVEETVTCKIDFDERYEKMQCHTAEHILSGLIHTHFGLDNVGFHLGADYVTMDVSGVLERADLDRIEDLANAVVFANVAVTSEFPTPDELPTMNYRAKLDLTENVRIVRIGEYDACACCAPHVARSGECGLIKILDFQKLRGGIRMFITAGRRALTYFRAMFNSASEISQLLSVPKEEISDGVSKLAEALAKERADFKAYRLSSAKARAAAIEPTSGNLVLHFADLEGEELRVLASEAMSAVDGILVVLGGSDGAYKYVIASNSTDLRAASRDINAALGGRGGGSPTMIQGSFTADLDAIKSYFEAK